jgi:hypothetical protein
MGGDEDLELGFGRGNGDKDQGMRDIIWEGKHDKF